MKIGDDPSHNRARDGEGNALPKGGSTVVRLIDADAGATVGLGYAFCSPRDNFNKRLGRTIALGRAVKGLHK